MTPNSSNQPVEATDNRTTLINLSTVGWPRPVSHKV
jgi:hypothetical protein